MFSVVCIYISHGNAAVAKATFGAEVEGSVVAATYINVRVGLSSSFSMTMARAWQRPGESKGKKINK